MTPFIHMLWFHLRGFAHNTYFVQLLLTSTLSVLIFQWLASLTSQSSLDATAWLRAGMVGTWSVSTVAAGLIGYQRFQGTLVHLLLTPLPTGRVLLALIAAASSFGMLAFPLAAGAASLAGVPLGLENPVATLMGVVALWLACLALSTVIASLFVLTPHALVYEGLLVVPLILVSSMFGLPETPKAWIAPLHYLIPTPTAVSVILAQHRFGETVWLTLTLSFVISGVWLVLGHLLMRLTDKRARDDGTLEII